MSLKQNGVQSSISFSSVNGIEKFVKQSNSLLKVWLPLCSPKIYLIDMTRIISNH